MKTVFAVRGKSNVGKSSTIKRVLVLLQEKFPEPKSSWDAWKERKGRGDICGVLTIDGVKIGIEGQGDVAENLRCSLDKFKEAGCELIVCTDRTTRQNFQEHLVLMETGGWKVEWKPKSFSIPAHREANDEAVAREIVDEIAETLSSAVV